MSLSRAFKYAGCPNIVTSLHKVDDQSTSQLMVNFYEQLKAGKGKADALGEVRNTVLAAPPSTAAPSAAIPPHSATRTTTCAGSRTCARRARTGYS